MLEAENPVGELSLNMVEAVLPPHSPSPPHFVLAGPLVLGAADLPPIGHPVYAGAIVGGVVVGLVALRATVSLRQGPSAAWAPGEAGRWRAALMALATGGGGVLGFVCYGMILGFSNWPPGSSEHRAGWSLLGLGVVSAVLAMLGLSKRCDASDMNVGSRVPAWAWLVAAALLLGALSGVAAFWPWLQGTELRWKGVIGMGALAALTAAMALPLGAMDRRGQGVSSAVILAGVAMAAGAALLVSGSIAFGQIGLGVGMTLAGVMIAVLIKRSAIVGGLLIASGCASIGGLLAAGQAWSYMPLHSGAIVACAPLAGFLVDGLLTSRRSPKARAIVRIVVAALVAGIGVATAVSLEGRAGGSNDYMSNE